jgi:hypothetical protein
MKNKNTTKQRTTKKKKSLAKDIAEGEFIEIKTSSKYDEDKRKSLISSLIDDAPQDPTENAKEESSKTKESKPKSPEVKKDKDKDRRGKLVDLLVGEDSPKEDPFEEEPKESSDKKSTKKSIKKNNDVMLIHWNGRFGNRMHTYAYVHARAKKFGGELYLPSDWEGKHLFNLDYKTIEDDDLRLHLNQSIQPFDKLDYRLERVKEYNEKTSFNFKYISADNPQENFRKYNHGVCIDSVCAYHHSIFANIKLSDVLSLYEFNDTVKNLDIYKKLEDRQGTYDIAHLRRDDISNTNYKNNGGYSVISKDSYQKAFKKYGYDPDKIEWTTDDWSTKWGVGNPFNSGLGSKRGSWNYPVGSENLPKVIFDWLPDFLRIYFARSIFRANSSFSFWACTLAKGRETPPKIFSPRLDKRVLYAKEETFEQEAEFDFEEGNHPHWLCITGKDQCDDIIFSDER